MDRGAALLFLPPRAHQTSSVGRRFSRILQNFIKLCCAQGELLYSIHREMSRSACDKVSDLRKFILPYFRSLNSNGCLYSFPPVCRQEVECEEGVVEEPVETCLPGEAHQVLPRTPCHK